MSGMLSGSVGQAGWNKPMFSPGKMGKFNTHIISAGFQNLRLASGMFLGPINLGIFVIETTFRERRIHTTKKIDSFVARKPVIFQVAHMSPHTVLGGEEEISTKLSKIVGIGKITDYMGDFADINVVVPKLAGVNNNLSLIPFFQLDAIVAGKREILKVSRVQDPSLRFNLFAVENSTYLKGDKYYDENFEFPVEAADILATAALNLAFELGQIVDLFHLLGWESSLVASKIGRYKNEFPQLFSGTRTIFEPIEFRLLRRSSFDRSYFQRVVEPGSNYDPDTMDYYNRVSLLKAGLFSPGTDLVIALNSETMLAARNEQKYGPELSTLIDNLDRTGRLRCLFEKWDDSYTPERIAQAYLQILKELFPRRGVDFTLDLTDMMIKAVEEGEVALDNFLMNIRAWELESAPLTNLYVNMIDHPVLANTRQNRIIGFAPGTRMETGSAILGCIGELLSSPQYNPGGRNQIALNGGLGTRLGVLSLAEGAKKGNVRILGRKSFEQSSIQTLPIIAQLPNGGKGRIVIYGTDNILISAELTVGVFPLRDAKQGILLFAQPQEILGKAKEDVKKVEKLGILLADPFSGELVMFREKLKLDPLIELLMTHKLSGVFKNTFIMVITGEVAREMNSLYSKPTPKDGVTPLNERDVDWSKHIITPMTFLKNEWMGRYDNYLLEKKTAARIFMLGEFITDISSARDKLAAQGNSQITVPKLNRTIDRANNLLRETAVLFKDGKFDEGLRKLIDFQGKNQLKLPELYTALESDKRSETEINEIKIVIENLLNNQQMLFDRILTKEEWDVLWENASILKSKFGVGVVNIGDETNSRWFDTGTPDDLKLVHQQAVSENPAEAATIRRAFGIPPGQNVVNSYVSPDVTLPDGPNFLVLNSSLSGSGYISRNSVVTGSAISGPEVNQYSIVSMSNISERTTQQAGSGGNNLVYRFIGSEDSLTQLTNTAISTVFDKESGQLTARHNLSGPSEDQIIHGIGKSFRNLVKEKVPPFGSRIDYSRGMIEDANLERKIRGIKRRK